MYNITSFDSWYGFMSLPNLYTGGWFWTVMLLAMAFVVFFVAYANSTAEKAFATTAFFTWFVSIFMFRLGFIPWIATLGFSVVMVIVAISWLISRGSRET